MKLDTTKKKHLRVRKSVSGNEERPRLSVFRSDKHIYASLVLDTAAPNKVVTTVSSLSPSFREQKNDRTKGGNNAGAALVGTLLAVRAKELGIAKVVFDRGPHKYAGRLKALADAARKGGLQF